MATIQDVLSYKGADVVTVRPEVTIGEAIGQLIERKIGSLLVVKEGGEIAGILTERDILRVVHEGTEHCARRQVGEVMTADVVCGVPEDDLDYVMSVMTERRFRRMPVIEGGRLAGIISIGDVVKALKSEKEYEVRQLKQYISGGYA